MKISEFFNKDYVDQASYDNLRKISSIIDGQKNASRKILHTILEKGIKSEIKVSQLGSKVAEFAEYLHGSMDGVIVGLAQNYPGSNNIPLLAREGNFGTRFNNEASASRYIYTHGTPEFFELFSKEDIPILKHQFFEGTQIEPMFFVPNLPVLLINGSEGVSTGFAQKILPRDPEKIKGAIKAILTNKPYNYDLAPFFAGFNGTIERGDSPAQWLIKGRVKRIGINKVQITEVPVGYDLRSYINVLNDLEDKRVIQSYRDISEDDNFNFSVTIPSKDLKAWDDETLMTKLKLVKKVTENYTVIDENNKIVVYNTCDEMLAHYMRVKLEYLAKRKEYMVSKLEGEIQIELSKYIFIKMVVNDELILSKRKKSDIVADLEQCNEISTKDDSYDYLLKMPLMNLTSEELDKLDNRIKTQKANLNDLINTTIEHLWISEIK